MEKSLHLHLLSLHYFFPALNLRYCNSWRNWEIPIFFLEICECINTIAAHHIYLHGSWKKKACVLLQKISPCSFMFKVKKPGNVSFRKCISTMVGKLCPRTEAVMILPLSTHAGLPPPRGGRILLYLDVTSCFFKLTTFPDFLTFTGLKSPRELKQTNSLLKESE